MYDNGSAKTRTNNRKYACKFYRCENKKPPTKGTNCLMKSVSQIPIEDAVWKEVTSIAVDSEKLASLIAEEDQKLALLSKR